MGVYLVRGAMSREAIKSLMAKPEDRTAALRSLVEAAGGKLLHFGYSASTGETISLLEAPSLVAVWSYAGVPFIGGVTEAGGSVEELMTPAQFVETLKGIGSLAAKFRPPGK